MTEQLSLITHENKNQYKVNVSVEISLTAEYS